MIPDLSDDAVRTLPAVLSAWAQATPNATFLMHGDAKESFATTERAVNRLANGLRDIGIEQGDRVAIVMGSRADYVRLTLAVNRIGAIWVPINPDYRGEWLSEAIRASMPAALIVEAPYTARVAEVIDDIGVERVVVLGEAGPLVSRASDFAAIENASDAMPAGVSVAPGDTAAILWTSGTTGKPKGVMQSHNAWISGAEYGNRNWQTRRSDVGYNCLPLYNSAAWCATIFRALVAGIPVGIDPAFSVSGFWDRIRHYGATQTMTLGAMHVFLFNAPERSDDADSPLRVAGMTPLPEHMIEPMRTRFGLERIVQGYGQSEAMTLLSRSSEPGQSPKPNCLGTPNPDFELALFDEEGKEVSPGITGEFVVRPKRPHLIFNGYFNNPQATEGAFADGWYHTGDLGMRDTDGDWFFVDRKKDYIRYKGRSVSSFQVEHVASRYPGLHQCAAYGVPSAELESEHEIKLDVVVKAGETVEPEALARFINDNAPHFIVPRFIELVDTLPYTPTNKIEKYKLRARGIGEHAWDRLATGFELAR